MKIVATNKKAFHEYEIIEKIEAGISLLGCEVKSIRSGRINLKGGYVRVGADGAYLENVNIAPYPSATGIVYEPLRSRKLLLHKNEIKRLIGKVTQKGFSIIPLECYFNARGIAKILIALVKGRRQYDRKEAIKKKDIEREIRRNFAEKFKS